MSDKFTKTQMIALIDAMNDRPIAFNRHYVALGCGINGALMLSQMVYWSKRTNANNGYFYKTQEDWELETGLTRREQETARKRLKQLGFVTEHKHGVPCKVYFKVDHDAIYDALIKHAHNSQTSLAESAKLECTKATNCDGGIRQTNTENTTKITSYIKKIEFVEKLRKALSESEAKLDLDEIANTDWYESEINRFTAFNEEKDLTENQTLIYLVKWLSNEHKNRSKPKSKNQPAKTQLSDSQIHMFSQKLARLDEFGNKYSEAGESYDDFAQRIADRLSNPKQAKKWESYLKQVGFKGELGECLE